MIRIEESEWDCTVTFRNHFNEEFTPEYPGTIRLFEHCCDPTSHFWYGVVEAHCAPELIAELMENSEALVGQITINGWLSASFRCADVMSHEGMKSEDGRGQSSSFAIVGVSKLAGIMVPA